MDAIPVVLAISLAVLFLFLGMSVWIAISLGASGIVAIFLFTGLPPAEIVGRATWNSSHNYALVALPMFIAIGEILMKTPLSQWLFDGLKPWVNALPGKLLHTNIVGCAMFAAVSGSSVATTATIGKVTSGELLRRKYDPGITLGSLCGAGTLGLLIPPSIIPIIYAAIVGGSVGQLFMAGVFPGIMITVMFMGYIMVKSKITPNIVPQEKESYTWGERFKALLLMAPVVSLIGFILVSVYTGLATFIEAAAIGVAGALIIAGFNKSLSFPVLKAIILGTVKTNGLIMFILIGSYALSFAMANMKLPQQVTELATDFTNNKWLILFLLAIMYLIMGMFLDGTSMMVLTLPVAFPVVTTGFGFDPVWFGVYLIILIELSNITPPVGFNLYVIQVMTGRPIGFVARNSIPFMIILLFSIVVITIFPQIVLFLPETMFR
jgi:tripartite ATP-independent transporter DctM subunit|tara:strand:+ start:3461 stop:4768 length:1308 start_codon:yes stop_codon:yes gene_type:complete